MGKIFFITLHENGTASTAWRGGDHGTWKVQDNKAVIHWVSGWKDIISRSNGHYAKTAYPPNAPIKGAGMDNSSAQKVEAVPFVGFLSK